MSNDTAINILLFCLADNDAEQIIACCRRAGRVAHTQGIETGEKLAEVILEKQWDVLIFDAERSQLDVQRCGHILRKHQVDISLIFMGEGDPLNPPDPAVTDIISKYDVPQIVGAALREQRSQTLRRQLKQREIDLKEAEGRNELLLADHLDPLAYITDGMIIYANPPFCEHMGNEDLEGFPIVDLITNKDQDRFKNALKKQQLNKDQQQLEISFAHSDGREIKTLITCNSANYDGEACIQLSLNINDSNNQFNGVDLSTQMSNKYRFQEVLQEFIENERNSDSSLILLSLDRFSKLRQSSSLLDVEKILEAISKHVREVMPAQFYGRVADDMIAAICHHVSSDAALEMGLELCKTIENDIFEIKKKSLQCTASIAIMPINHLTPPRASVLLDTLFHGAEKIFLAGGNNAEICHRERQQLSTLDAATSLASEALNQGRLTLLFQPMINLGNADGDHYEASLDIKDWVEGEVTAGELLRVIEQEPDNNKLDHWIVVEATKQLAKERQTGQDLKLIINLSGNVFHDPEFCSWLSVAFKAAGLPPSSVILQFNEESIANALKPALNFAQQLQKMGSALSVRNFGRAQKGNKFLSHIQPHLVKPGFRKTDTPSDEQIKDIVAQAKMLKSRVLIPNVGSAATLAMLWQLGPDFIQGSYVNEPMPSMNYEFASFN
ncbi:EAL domain-containing protein (putative c-di-GMP-specific phosphodiesterase class I)/GGDEF domain-containing protein [Zhongshania antarctica]|uniref:EAL domain-containing protein (Putative c-di-GMP-specific phosphodiesterase class I)/GGDEF domain-containing protein n=1 Tax=Zhongshania antarctica TaxID=641702 RepID=A0A840R6U1_9GAMM|nr:EAL domain-containing protein [Zhongshania antarctica]MBB5188965.1 EAL domain-containing protein (putative c-di-GMP-specific phosphodiesterase class I)/GGDEF domain-containing protein [Zhongshania antarctica]